MVALLVRAAMLWSCHQTPYFEMLNIGYAAYLNLFMFCRQAFPGITDQTLAHMLSGTETMYMRPDAELRKLSRLAIDLGVADTVVFIHTGGLPALFAFSDEIIASLPA